METLIRRPYFKKIFMCIMPVIVSLLVLFSTVAYGQYIRNERQTEINAYNEELRRITLQVDDRFGKIYDLTSGLMNREWVKRMYSRSEIMREYFDYARSGEIYQEMSIYNVWMGFTKTIAILDMNQNLIVDKDGWQEYDAFCRRIGVPEEEQEELLELLQKENGPLAILDPGWKDQLGNELCFISREIGQTPSSRCYFLAVFYKDSFASFLHELNADIGGFFIRNEGESLVTYQDAEWEGEVVSFPSGTPFGWEYEIALNGDAAGKIEMTQWVVFLVMLLLIACSGALLSFWLTFMLYHPMLGLLKNLHLLNTGNQDEYSAILSHVELLNREKEKARQEADQYYRIARNVLLQKILYGYFDKKDSVKEQKRYRLQLSDDRWYQVIRAAQDDDEGVFLLKKAVEDYLKLKKFYYEMAESFNHEFFIILILNSEKEVMERAELSEFRDNLKSFTGKRITLIGGTCEKKVIGISKSYSNIQEILLESKNGEFTGSARMVETKRKIYYPTDWEIQLITQLKYGNSNVVNGILTELDRENHGRVLSQEEQMKITAVIFDTLIRVMAELDIRDNELILKYHHNRRFKNDAEQWKLLYEAADTICGEIQNRMDKKSASGVVEQIREYVDQNFSDPQLSLKQISDEFGLSESSVSRMFKNHFRELFAEYVCRMRMEKAKEYLQTGSYTVKAVAGMVGYNNELSFSRAFLKYEGVRPSAYMELFRLGQSGKEGKKEEKKDEGDDYK